MTLIYRVIIFLSCSSFFFNDATAQPQKGKFINGNIGLAVSFPYEDFDISSTGLYIQGEYVYGVKTWLGIRPYLGFITTSPNEDLTSESLSDYEVTANAFLLGTKVRLAAPIPWISPFIELGLGASIGAFKTFTPTTNKDAKGLLYHVPISFGLALGPKHNVEIAFTYYEHPSVDQVSGAAAFGLSFPIK